LEIVNNALGVNERSEGNWRSELRRRGERILWFLQREHLIIKITIFFARSFIDHSSLQIDDTIALCVNTKIPAIQKYPTSNNMEDDLPQSLQGQRLTRSYLEWALDVTNNFEIIECVSNGNCF
jgi:hypothetical protein